MKHSRILILLFVSFACVGLNFWLVTTGHYRLPLLVFVAAVGLVVLAFRKLPPATNDPQEININLLKASASVRRLGFLYIFGFAMAIVGLFTGEFKELPLWGVALLFAWSGILIWACFRGAKWYKEKAGPPGQDTQDRNK